MASKFHPGCIASWSKRIPQCPLWLSAQGFAGRRSGERDPCEVTEHEDPDNQIISAMCPICPSHPNLAQH